MDKSCDFLLGSPFSDFEDDGEDGDEEDDMTVVDKSRKAWEEWIPDSFW